jgi:hypothetical protein
MEQIIPGTYHLLPAERDGALLSRFVVAATTRTSSLSGSVLPIPDPYQQAGNERTKSSRKLRGRHLASLSRQAKGPVSAGGQLGTTHAIGIRRIPLAKLSCRDFVGE